MNAVLSTIGTTGGSVARQLLDERPRIWTARRTARSEMPGPGARTAMIDRWLFSLTLCSALGCGLVAGAFFAFSVFVMKGLDDLPPARGIAAMQSINVTVINVWFMGVLFGTAMLSLIAAVVAVRDWAAPGSAFLLAGSLLYLVGSILVTVACNVPLNDALAAVDPDSAAGAARWATYVPDWTAWNHVRTIASLAASTAFIVALVRQAQASGLPG